MSTSSQAASGKNQSDSPDVPLVFTRGQIADAEHPCPVGELPSMSCSAEPEPAFGRVPRGSFASDAHGHHSTTHSAHATHRAAADWPFSKPAREKLRPR